MTKSTPDDYHLQKFINKMAEAEMTPSELAMVLGLSLEQVAELATRPSMVKTLQGLARLADIRAQLLLSRYRANAALQLINIASAKEPTELSRKACVDLLKMDLEAFKHIPAPRAKRTSS